MAKFELELPNDLIKQLETLEQNTEEIMGRMTRAGAEASKELIEKKAPHPEIAKRVKLSKTYKTPSDKGINTKVYFSGYIPFSDPNRKYFSRKGGNGKTYRSTEGVPTDFLAKLYEYGKQDGSFPKKPFIRTAFKNSKVEQAMEKEWNNAFKTMLGIEE